MSKKKQEKHFHCFKETAQEAFSRLGIKQTKPRVRILNFLRSVHDHLDAENIHRALQEPGDRSIGLATVYRTLRLLEDVGLLERHDFGDRRTRYEILEEQALVHYHIVDVQTQDITEILDSRIEDVLQKICEEHNVEMVSRDIKIYVKKK